MAIYHLSVKTISRTAGRTATAAAAYRAGVEITDERTGEIHDYTRKGGVVSTNLVLPADAPAWASDRAALWNAAELAEKRKNSTVAREFEIALPVELNAKERGELAMSFARELAERHKCAVDVAIHEPGKEGDNRNHHAHLLTTTRRLGKDGLGEKCRELDDQKTGEVPRWRQRWGELANTALERAGHADRIDHRSHKDRGLMPEMATVHLGPAATAIARRHQQSERGQRNAAIIEARRAVNAARRERTGIEQEIHAEEKRDQQPARAGTATVSAPAKPPPAIEQKKPRLEDLPIAEQAKVWDLTMNRGATARQEKAVRVAHKAAARLERRDKAYRDMHGQKPQEPTGMLAAFKRKAFEASHAAWSKAYGQARRLVDQAQTLRTSVYGAADQVQARGWAFRKLSQSQPDLAERVQAYRQQEARKRLEQQQREREAKRALQKEKGTDQGQSR